MPDNAALTMPSPGLDPSGKPRPSLSATADLPPVIDPASAPEPVAVEPEPVPEPVKTEPDKTKDDTPPWMKAEVTKQRNARRQAEREAAETRQQLATALEALKNVQPKAEPKQEPDISRPQRPRRDGFDNPTAYEAALDQYDTLLADWAQTTTGKHVAEQTRREIAETQRKERETAQRKENEQVAQAITERWEKAKEKAIEKYPDWEEIAQADEIQISQPMAATLMLIENGADVAYHLGKHPKDAERIAKMAPALQSFELGKLAAQIDAPKIQTSKAPPPIKPLRSSASALERGDDELSMDEYANKAIIRINPARARQMGLVK